MSTRRMLLTVPVSVLVEVFALKSMLYFPSARSVRLETAALPSFRQVFRRKKGETVWSWGAGVDYKSDGGAIGNRSIARH